MWLGAVSPASAQAPVEIRASAPEKPPQIRIVEPTPATREATRPREADFYGGTDVRVRLTTADLAQRKVEFTLE